MTDLVARLQEPFARWSDTRAAIDVSAGGSGANQACWLASQGVPTAFVGRVGGDLYGQFHRRELRRCGVQAYLSVDARRGSGMVVVLVDEQGQRSMLADRGANLSLHAEHLPPHLFRAGTHLHLSGYTLFEPATRDAGLEALRWAREAGMTISVDPSSFAPLAQLGPTRFLEWTHGAEVCFPNLEEGRLLTGEQQPLAIVQVLLRHYRSVALKLGADGALCADEHGQSHEAPAHAVMAVDSTGAGDAFCAGYLAAWLRGGSLAAALEAAIELAATAIAQVGARPPRQRRARRAGPPLPGFTQSALPGF